MSADISMEHTVSGPRAKGLTAAGIAAAAAARSGRHFLWRAFGKFRERRHSVLLAARPRRLDLRDLQGMSDHMLADIGLTRGDVHGLGRTPIYHL